MDCALDVTRDADRRLIKPIKAEDNDDKVCLYSINPIGVFGECKGNFGHCTGDYVVCNDDKP